MLATVPLPPLVSHAHAHRSSGPTPGPTSIHVLAHGPAPQPIPIPVAGPSSQPHKRNHNRRRTPSLSRSTTPTPPSPPLATPPPSAYSSEATNEWRAWVPLMPGTHHIRFQVDGQVTTAEDLPTAVDDNGTIANYVAVPLSGNTPPSAFAAALAHPTPTKENPNNHLPPAISTAVGASFFADAQANANEDAAWTDRTPWQLECAAEEEESWLTHGQQAHSQPPQHPQAPSLPRHLEKLIMNQKMPSGTGSARAGAGVGGSRAGPGGGVSNNNRSGGGATSGVGSVVGGQLPVVTASGTNLSAGTSGGGKGTSSNNTAGVANFTTKEMYTKLVDAAGLADDGSVLPVPSHVVLHHLGTSAIRNGVLAVADTMRYKKKVSFEFEFLPSSPPPWDSFPFFFFDVESGFVNSWLLWSVMQYITTIYYKPT